MGKKNRKKRRLADDTNNKNKAFTKITPTATTATTTASTNPLLEKLETFLQTQCSAEERQNGFFSPQLDPERRAELWMQQAELGESLVQNYAWAAPDARALRIVAQFAPLVEIGCGANAYWCRQLVQQAGVDIIGYDKDPTQGGRMSSSYGKRNSSNEFRVRKGGPEVLVHHHADRTLFLCYPDDEDNDDGSDGDELAAHDDDPPISMGAACLQHYKGDTVIHVGELFLDATLSMDQAPWGRSSSPEFQQLLAAQFHCILHVRLPSWLHTRDSLSVWKRSETCSIVFAADDKDDEDEEVLYRHIPLEEQLPVDIAAPCVQHLLEMPVAANVAGGAKETQTTIDADKDDDSKHEASKVDDQESSEQGSNEYHEKSERANDTNGPGEKKGKKKRKKRPPADEDTERTTMHDTAAEYECPW